MIGAGQLNINHAKILPCYIIKLMTLSNDPAHRHGFAEEIIPGVRNAVRAVVWRDDQLLLQHKKGYLDGSERFALPGGGQDSGETLEQALLRECREELGVELQIKGLLHVADFYKLRETIPPTRRHQVEFLYCLR